MKIAQDQGFVTELFKLDLRTIAALRKNNILWKDTALTHAFIQKIQEVGIQSNQLFLPNFISTDSPLKNLNILEPNKGELFEKLVYLIVHHNLDPKILIFQSEATGYDFISDLKSSESSETTNAPSFPENISEVLFIGGFSPATDIQGIELSDVSSKIRFAENYYFLLCLQNFLEIDNSNRVLDMLKAGEISTKTFIKCAVDMDNINNAKVMDLSSGRLDIRFYTSVVIEHYIEHLEEESLDIFCEVLKIQNDEVFDMVLKDNFTGRFLPSVRGKLAPLRIIITLAQEGHEIAIKLLKNTNALETSLEFSDSHPEAFNYLIESLTRGSKRAQDQAEAIFFSEAERLMMFGNAYNTHCLAQNSRDNEVEDNSETYQELQDLLLELKEAKQTQKELNRQGSSSKSWVEKVWPFGNDSKTSSVEIDITPEEKSIDELMQEGNEIIDDITAKIREVLSRARENRELSEKTIGGFMKEAGIAKNQISITGSSNSVGYLQQILEDKSPQNSTGLKTAR